MYLGDLIKYLEDKDENIVVSIGLGEADSYRGYYEDLAFEPKANVAVKDMLEEARNALGKTFRGYKGGEFEMTEDTRVWISEYGTTHNSQRIGKLLLDYMLNEL